MQRMDLSIHANEHCNLNCKGCTPFSPIAEEEYCNLEILDRSLRNLSRMKKGFNEIKIVGGEPLLNRELAKMIKIVRTHFDKNPIYIWTNGILLQYPERMPADFWKACKDYDVSIRITAYPIRLDYARLIDTCKSNGVEASVFIDKSDGGSGWLSRKLNEKGNINFWSKLKVFKLWRCDSYNCMHLVEDKIFACSPMGMIKHMNRRFGTDFQYSTTDFLFVEKIKKFSQIRKYLFLESPFCRYCPGKYLSSHWEVSKKAKEEWINTSY